MTNRPDRVTGLLAVTNSDSSTVRLVLEPWAEERILRPDSTIVIEYSGPRGGRLEIERTPGEIIVYGWEGAVMSILDERSESDE